MFLFKPNQTGKKKNEIIVNKMSSLCACFDFDFYDFGHPTRVCKNVEKCKEDKQEERTKHTRSCGDEELEQWNKLNEDLINALNATSTFQQQVILWAQSIIQAVPPPDDEIKMNVLTYLANTIVAASRTYSDQLIDQQNSFATLIQTKWSKC